MGKFEPAPPIGGAAELTALLDVLRDSEKYAARLKVLQDTRDEINAKVALAGQAEAIPGLYAAAAEDRRAAADMLNAAKAEATKIKGAAETARDAARADADIARAEAAAARSAIAKEQGEWAEAKELHRVEILRLDTEAKLAFATAQTMREQAEALRAEWQAKTDALREAMAR